ncbi:MAG: outer membrane beta-barrel family protein, partial [Muribaculaceae bacterium]|nr:outer membrane beta-barrel family protein [Muribaculaceae bacterium]
MKILCRFITFLLLLSFVQPVNAQVWSATVSSTKSKGDSDKKKKEKSYFRTSLKDATFKRDVDHAFIIPYDKDGNPLDTIKAQGYKWNGSEVIPNSAVSVPVEQGDTIVIFDAGAPGFSTETITWTFQPFGKRELSRSMPPIYLSKVRELKEVTVTSSKVKFYNKGDTIVYDADAFQLAEGSMLDALISQLPGAKIDENGRITVNGEFVESLLLNGKDFFNDDHSLMLENIPAYTVKSVEVYKGHTKEEKFNLDQSEPRHLTMDVKLKKEYSNGWLLNFQGGYGTSDRYLARLFASWFSPTTSVIVTGATNNLNDIRTPGRDDSWTPESMPSGTQSHREAGIKYHYESVDEKVTAQGSVDVTGNSTDYSNTTSATRFLNNTDSYERSFRNSKSSRFSVSTNHWTSYITPKQHRLSISLGGDYSRSDNNDNSLSATFNKDYSDISYQTLDAIYANGSLEELGAIVNRSKNRTEGSLRSGSFRVSPTASLKLPGSNDRLNFSVGFNYVTSKRHAWNDYIINFGSDPTPAERRLQYTDESPNYSKEINAQLGYQRPMRNAFFNINYKYTFTDRAKDSYMYALDRLGDRGIFGVLPENYVSTLDPANSYTSATRSSTHWVQLMYQWYKTRDNDMFLFNIMPAAGVDHHHLDYWRENRSYLVKRTSLIIPRTYTTLWFDYRFGKPKDEQGRSYRNELSYRFNIDTDEPELLHLVDVINDSDPLNIQEGNPHLKNSLRQSHNVSWTYRPFGKSIYNTLGLEFSTDANALVRGYVYDTATGIRRFRTYNVSGNHSFNAYNSFNYNFGSKQQFSLGSGTKWSLDNNTDMVGTNTNIPEKVQVSNQSINQHLGFFYHIGKQEIQFNGSLTHRHTSSERLTSGLSMPSIINLESAAFSNYRPDLAYRQTSIFINAWATESKNSTQPTLFGTCDSLTL